MTQEKETTEEEIFNSDEKEKKTDYYVSANGSRAKVLEVYESFTGWYWYITDKPDEVEWFGLVKGFETEWGYIYVPELLGSKYVWKVPRMNWIGVPLLEHS